MVHSGQLGAGVRRHSVSFPVKITAPTAGDLRVYPPPLQDWRLVGGRWAVIGHTGPPTGSTLTIKTAGAVAVTTPLGDSDFTALNARGALALNATDDGRREVSPGGGGYFVVSTVHGSGAEVILLQLDFEAVEPSGKRPR